MVTQHKISGVHCSRCTVSYLTNNSGGDIVRFDHLTKLLTEDFGLDSNVFTGNIEFSKMNFIENQANDYPSDILYVCFEDSFFQLERLPHNLLVIYKSEAVKKRIWQKLDSAHVNALYVHYSKYAKIINFIQNLLNAGNGQSDSYAGFLRMIVNGSNLSYIVSEASKQCGKQLIILDFSGKIIAHSQSYDVVDPEWERFIRNGYCPAESMQHFYELFLKRTEVSTKPYLYECAETGILYLSSPIVINGYPHGYVFMISKSNDLGPKAYDILPVMSRVAADYVQSNFPAVTSSAQLYRSIIGDILQGESPEAIKSRMISSKLKIPKRMRLILVRSFYHQNSLEYLKQLRSQLALLFTPIPPIYYDNSLVIIQNFDENRTEQTEKEMLYLKELTNSNRLIVGISNEFSDLQELAQHYCQADDALKLSARLRIEDNIVYYKDVSFFAMLSKLSVGEHMRQFCHPALKLLREYDDKNGTELFETLRVLTDTNFNQKLTAEKLFTHRNTIAYRRQQILELAGIDFSDSEELFQLSYSFKIYNYLEP